MRLAASANQQIMSKESLLPARDGYNLALGLMSFGQLAGWLR